MSRNNGTAWISALLIGALLLGGCADRQPDSTPPTTSKPSDKTQPEGAQAPMAQLRIQAERGDLDSQFQLGSFYFVGEPKKDLKQAEYWWKQAADQGHAAAAVSLAYLYTGRDHPEFANQKDMLKYLSQSAAGGNPMAQHILGNQYLKGGPGVARNPNQARALFQSACQQNYSASCEILKTLP